MPAVSAVARVIVSLPLPPLMVSVLATVAALLKLPNVSLSSPVPRSIEALAAAVPRVMVSLPEPPSMVSVLAMVAELVPFARVNVSAPAPRRSNRR